MELWKRCASIPNRTFSAQNVNEDSQIENQYRHRNEPRFPARTICVRRMYSFLRKNAIQVATQMPCVTTQWLPRKWPSTSADEWFALVVESSDDFSVHSNGKRAIAHLDSTTITRRFRESRQFELLTENQRIYRKSVHGQATEVHEQPTDGFAEKR